MRIAYLECFSGMSGDMFLGALIDAGVPLDLLSRTTEALNLGARLEVSRVDRSGIAATKVDVYVGGEKDMPREEYLAQRESSEHHSHQHRPNQQHTNDHHHQHGRGLKQIREIIGGAPISNTARQIAIGIFETLGAAEAKIHNRDMETIHFHEVGSVDALVDIVGAAVGFEALGVDELVCSPINVGSGTVHCSHGTFPVPAPATIAILEDTPVYSSGVAAELLTPTGAAIVKTLAKRFGSFPAMKVNKTSYGAGTRNPAGFPNVVRLTVGDTQSVPVVDETIVVIEANLDDMSPQLLGYALERLLQEGSLDVFAIPAQMKKNRPGTLLTVLCLPEDRERLAEVVLAETTTLGVRWREERRSSLPRTWVPVETQWGQVRIKVGSLNGSATHFAPEYEDCRQIAIAQRVPLKQVIHEALRAYAELPMRQTARQTPDYS